MSEVNPNQSHKLLKLFVFSLVLTFSLGGNLASAQVSGFPSGKSLSLTIWGAGLSSSSVEGRAWDAQSLPDSLVRVYLAGRLVGESGVQKDKQQPMWALTVGPFLEYQFIEGGITIKVLEQDVFGEELIEELEIPLPKSDQVNRVAKLEGVELKPLIFQWVDSSAQFRSESSPPIRERRFSLEEGGESPDARLETSRRGRSPKENSDQETEAQRIAADRARSAKRASTAANLYRAYLKAQFSGDQLQEHRILLTLIQRYGQTRHGRKARRILLLDGR